MSFPICGLGDGCRILIVLRILPIILILRIIPIIICHCIIPRGLAGGEYARLRAVASGAGLLEFKEFVG